MLPYPKSTIYWLQYKTQFNRVVDLIEKLEIKKNLSHIIMYASPSLSFWGNMLRKWCKKNGTYFIADCSDWMPTRGPFYFKISKWLDTTYQKRYLNSRADGVIAISEFLGNYYRKKKSIVIVIPPLTDKMQQKFNTSGGLINNRIKFVYIGTPFNNDVTKPSQFKDRLDVVIILLNKIMEKGFDFEFNIYGLTKEDYLKNLPNDSILLESCSNNIYFHGIVEHDEAISRVIEANFFIFLRDIKKMTMAGFPTKFVESMTAGTPIITNKTSDIELYLKEGETGFFLDYPNLNKSLDKLEYILGLSEDKLSLLKENCNKFEAFDYSNYLSKTKKFLELVNSKD